MGNIFYIFDFNGKNISEVKEMSEERKHTQEKPISEVYPEIDTDLARDNIENDFDLTAADMQDL